VIKTLASFVPAFDVEPVDKIIDMNDIIVILWCCIIGYGITLKLIKLEYKIHYNFMGSSLVFQFLDINVLNYCYFHINCLTFF